MSYKFVYDREKAGTWDPTVPAVITHEIRSPDPGLDDLLAAFEDFLKGCGFVFNGNVDIVSDNFSDRIDRDAVLDSTYPDGDEYWQDKDVK